MGEFCVPPQDAYKWDPLAGEGGPRRCRGLEKLTPSPVGSCPRALKQQWGEVQSQAPTRWVRVWAVPPRQRTGAPLRPPPTCQQGRLPFLRSCYTIPGASTLGKCWEVVPIPGKLNPLGFQGTFSLLQANPGQSSARGTLALGSWHKHGGQHHLVAMMPHCTPACGSRATLILYPTTLLTAPPLGHSPQVHLYHQRCPVPHVTDGPHHVSSESSHEC